MKLTNGAIYDIREAVQKFSDAKGRTAFVLFRALRKLQEEIQDCENQKNELIKKYGKENEDGSISISQDDKEASQKFFSEFGPILNFEIDVELPLMSEADFSALYDVDAPNATMNDYAIIDAFLVDHK